MATHFVGLERVKRRIARLPGKVRTEIKLSLEASATELVEMQQRLAPVDDGDLRDSIQKQPGRHDLSIQVVAGDERAFYARWVEFGTINQPANPFFFPAYRSLRKRIKSRTRGAMRKAIKANV